MYYTKEWLYHTKGRPKPRHPPSLASFDSSPVKGANMGPMIVDQGYLNAPALECSTVVFRGGERVVRYMGEEYSIFGLYFARSLNGAREVFYILRLIAGDDQRGYSGNGARPWEVHR